MPDELKNGTKEDEELIELTPQEQIRAMLETTEKGKPKNSLVNFVTVFQQDPVLKGAIRCNGLTERTDIVKDLGWVRNGTLGRRPGRRQVLFLPVAGRPG